MRVIAAKNASSTPLSSRVSRRDNARAVSAYGPKIPEQAPALEEDERIFRSVSAQVSLIEVYCRS